MILRAALMLGITVALIAVACGGGDDNNAPDPTEPSQTPVTGTPPPADATARPTRDLPLGLPVGATWPPGAETPRGGVTPGPQTTPGNVEDAPTRAAMDALAGWLGPVGDRASMTVMERQAVTWSNGCLDIGRADEACTEALVEGYRIGVALGDAVFEVRTDLNGSVARWAPAFQILLRFEEASTNSVSFTTDDDNTINAQPVPGTDFGVALDSLAVGDPVGVAFADSPQGGGLLLVWVDPAGEAAE